VLRRENGGKPACQFGAELRPGDWPPDHEGACRADVDGIEVLQLFGERGRSEGSVTTDFDPSQKSHECHAFPAAGPARKLIHSVGRKLIHRPSCYGRDRRRAPAGSRRAKSSIVYG
jgi:hypothetical protein